MGQSLRAFSLFRATLLMLIVITSYSIVPSHAASPYAATPNNVQSPSPCLAPSPADSSTVQVPASGTGGLLTGHVVPVVRRGEAAYLGPYPQSRSVRLSIVFAIRNLQQFQSCLNSIQDPNSPNYEHFLDATTLLPYLPTLGQKASVISFLTQNGFSVTEAVSALVIYASGPVGLAERVFGVHLNLYKESGYSFFASDSDPTLPTNFRGMINGILGLDNYTAVRPAESPCGASSPDCPQGIQVGYSLANLYAGGFNGAGQTVAIIDEPGDPNMQAALNNFTTQYNLPKANLQVLTPNGPVSFYDPGWASEAVLDVEAVRTVAPGATVDLLYGTGSASDDLVNLIDYAATNHLGVASNSWDFGCGLASCSDTELVASDVSSTDLRLMLDASMGLTILFASGDEGSKPDGRNLGTEFPASDPNVLAIGATNLFLAGCTNTSPFNCSGYGSETGASISSGGYSGFFQEPGWQLATIGNQSGRAVPDVSMLGFTPGLWVYSTLSDHCGLGVNSAGWFGCTGTSLSTPLWAGFLGVALQVRGGKGFGNVGPLLYQLGNSALYSSIFHDITAGSNGNYSAGPGWDPVTGWGTPIADKLALALTSDSVGGLGNLSGFTGLASGAILMVVGDIAVNPHGAKPAGVSYQTGRDSTPLGFISGMLTNPQPSKFDTDPNVINASSGRPTGSWSIVFGIGGPEVNSVTHYYETTSTAGDRAPITFSLSGSKDLWTAKNGTVIATIPISSMSIPPGTSDVFVIQTMRDTDGRLIVLIYGSTYLGTWAAAWYFKFIVYPTISNYVDSYYIVRWTDASSGPSADFVPDAGDTYTVIAQGN